MAKLCLQLKPINKHIATTPGPELWLMALGQCPVLSSTTEKAPSGPQRTSGFLNWEVK